jgi:hypothetical protein
VSTISTVREVPKTPSITEPPVLLAIIEVDREERIRCQAPGCNHPVYKRIHVVHAGGAFTAVGSECYRRLCGTGRPQESRPRLGFVDWKKLNDEERRLLSENTRRFVEMLQQKYPDLVNQPSTESTVGAAQKLSLDDLDPALVRELEEQVKTKLRNESFIDPELPGWRGWVRVLTLKLAMQLPPDLPRLRRRSQ